MNEAGAIVAKLGIDSYLSVFNEWVPTTLVDILVLVKCSPILNLALLRYLLERWGWNTAVVRDIVNGHEKLRGQTFITFHGSAHNTIDGAARLLQMRIKDSNINAEHLDELFRKIAYANVGTSSEEGTSVYAAPPGDGGKNRKRSTRAR